MKPPTDERAVVSENTNAENLPAVRPADKAPVALAHPLADLDQAWRVATALGKAYIVPKDLRGKPADILAILMYGRELGFNPMQSIQAIYVVNGRPQLSGQTWIAKVREAGHRHFVPCRACGEPAEHKLHRPGAENTHRYESDHDETRCAVTIIRGDTGERHSETFTWQDAERAKLVTKDIWRQYPKRMLLWRATSNCATIICPEVALGYGAEDPDDSSRNPVASLANAVDARVTVAEPPATSDPETGQSPDAGASEPVDAEIVNDPQQPEEDLAAADEDARRQVLELAAEHEQRTDSAAAWPEVAPIPGSDQ